MEDEITNGKLFCNTYRDDIRSLAEYIPWLTEKKGQDVSKKYEGEMGVSSIAFPVYDSVLIGFIKLAKTTNLIDKNYAYAYSGRRMRTHADEMKEISGAALQDVDVLRGIFSKYVLEGMTKSGRWTEAVNFGIFLEVLCKLRELLEFYD